MIPTRITFTGDTTLGNAQAEVLFNSRTAFPGSLHLLGQSWFSYAVFNTEAGGSSALIGEFSEDAGVTWLQFYDSGAHTTDTTLQDDVYIAGMKDVRFTYTNGATPGTISVTMALNCGRGKARSAATETVNG